MTVSIRTQVSLRGVEALLAAAGPRGQVALARGLNRTGMPTETAYLRSVRAVLGLRSHPYARAPVGQAVKRRTSRRKATAGRLTYSLAGFGKGLPAIYYQPKEGAAGATINWLGGRRLIERSFYLGGKFPRRRKSRISHTVWRRTGKGKWALDRPRGPGVPEAMQQAQTARVWETQAAARLPGHLRSALEAVIRGY